MEFSFIATMDIDDNKEIDIKYESNSTYTLTIRNTLDTTSIKVEFTSEEWYQFKAIVNRM